jgi:hypothetical protein
VAGPTHVSSQVIWSVEPPNAGTINQGGLLTVGAGAGRTFTVRARALGHEDVTSAATVTILESTGITIDPPDFSSDIGIDIDGPTVRTYPGISPG